MTGSIAKKIVMVSFVLFLLTGCASFENTLRFVTASRNVKEADLQEIYGPGVNFDYSWASGETGSIMFGNSGTASINYGDKQDSGSWNIQGDMLCSKWQELGAGEEHCYTVYRKWLNNDKFRLFNADGSAHATALLKR